MGLEVEIQVGIATATYNSQKYSGLLKITPRRPQCTSLQVGADLICARAIVGNVCAIHRRRNTPVDLHGHCHPHCADTRAGCNAKHSAVISGGERLVHEKTAFWRGAAQEYPPTAVALVCCGGPGDGENL